MENKYNAVVTPAPDAKLIIDIVCEYYNTDYETMILNRKSRKRESVITRHMCMYFIMKYTRNSLAQTGLIFGIDHATVLHGKTNIANLCEGRSKEIIIAESTLNNRISKIDFNAIVPKFCPVCGAQRKAVYATRYNNKEEVVCRF